MMRRIATGVLAVAAVCWAAPPPEGAPVFEQDVLPILSTYCFTCHGKSSPEQGLDLRTARTVLRGGFNGSVVEKGSPDHSRLYQKISEQKMPPPAFKSVVPGADVETIRRWIEAGAPSEESDELPESAREQIARFERDIQPLFAERCVVCHGGESPQSGLDLRTLASTLRGGEHGPVVAEGFSDKSILIRQLVSGAMPPNGVGEPLSSEEIERIRAWIDQGGFADYVDLGNPFDRAFTEAEAPPITTEDRTHWAFRRPQAAELPKTGAEARVRTPIDSFILVKLEEHGLSLAQPAAKRTLLRRAYFDLWGLPPTRQQTREFIEDSRPDAYERLIDRLLASPNYGQRWGRFWLDAAGYVDTVGKDFQANRPSLHPGMWRYRDYVIEAFNKDKPWDRFLTEQLAGDELHDWRSAEHYTPEMLEALVATGYLRTVLDATNEDISDRPADRYDTLFALMDKVSRSAVGLTLSCARCHSHKFDPLPQRDYYRFLSLFSAAYNPSDWIQPKHRKAYTVSAAEQAKIEAHNKTVDAEIEKLAQQSAGITEPYRQELFEQKLAATPEVVRDDLRQAIAAEAKDRSEVQKYLVTKFGPQVEVGEEEILEAATTADRARLTRLASEIETWKGYRNDLEPVSALWDGGEPGPIRLLQRGSVESPGPRVQPGFLSILCSPGEDCLAEPSPNRVGETSGYRLALAEWLTDPRHPLTARVIVNRIWMHHFGVGIVETADNFGRNGSAPSHPGLLDWLAVDFVENGWKAKRLHKMIMLSGVYRQSSRRTDNPGASQAEAADPDNRLLWRKPLRRLEAEALRDSVLAVAGRLDPALSGPPVMLEAQPDGLQLPEPEGATRRSVYLLARRTWPLTFLGAFDFPNIDTTCIRRSPSSTPLQSLTLMNSDFVLSNAAAVARRAQDQIASTPDDDAAFVRAGYSLTLAREPSADEVALAIEHLARQRTLFERANAGSEEARKRADESLAHMLISSNEFLYVD